jgi:hypothetical protein
MALEFFLSHERPGQSLALVDRLIALGAGPARGAAQGAPPETSYATRR